MYSEEYLKCKDDVVYFINKYVPKKKYSPLLADFKLFPYQEDLIKSFDDNSGVFVINTARQMGITSVMIGYTLHKIIFTDNYRACFGSNTLIEAIKYVQKIKDYYNNLPKDLKIHGIELDYKREFKLNNESSVVAMPVSRGAGKAHSLDQMFLDHCSFVEDIDQIYAAIMPILKPHAKIILNSTLYKEGWFADMCRKAETSQVDFTYIRLPYWLRPKFSRAWRLDLCKKLGEDNAKVQLDCSYVFDENGNVVPLIEEEYDYRYTG